MKMKTTHLGKTNIAEDSRFEHGPVHANVQGNHVILSRRHKDGSYPVISDEIIPDRYMAMVMADLEKVK